jgi:hypothetical protein
MALLLALLALLLISAIGLGMVYMSNMESEIAFNYRDTQTAFFSVRAGLEEMRDRMQHNSPSAITLPTTMPPAANSIVYITNPAAAETVTPATYGSLYFDDELCHEYFSPGPATAYSTPCGATGAAPAGSFTTVASVSPYTGTAAALKYKWVRLTLKQNATVGTVATQYVDSAQPANSPVCWNATTSQETTSTSLGAYATCTAAAAAGFNVEPVYLITALALTPQGSRRVAQYESAALNITPPPGALALDGPGATYNPAPSSNNYFINGQDSGAAGYNGPPGCSPTGANTPAITVGDAAGVTNMDNEIPSNRFGNYTGGGLSTPSVSNGGLYENPAMLNQLVANIASEANQSLTCPIGSPCSVPAGGIGTDATPLITYVNGDFNMGANSGAGILVVTGTLSITGNAGFDGLVLVIGQGILSESGGGNGQFNGSIFVANTNSHTSPYSQLAALGSPQIAWNGGGTNGIQYNSCWANELSNLGFIVVASREEMY